MQDPLSQNLNNYPPQINNTNSTTSNIYDNQIYSPNIPTPQPIEEKQEQSNLEVKEPVYQLQVLPEQRHNIPQKQSCCEDCCDDCDRCCDSCCRDCNDCCNDKDCQDCLHAFVLICQFLAVVGSCLAAFSN